jgi:hypothetical protein
MRRWRLIRTSSLALAAATVFACSRTAAGPTSSPNSSATSAATDLSTVDICHRDTESVFVRIVIPKGTTATHLGHGDAFPGHFVPGGNSSRLDQTCAITAVIGATITFKGLTSLGMPVTTFDEAGFRVTAVSGAWQEWPTYGAPVPMIIFMRPPSTVDASAEIEVHATEGLFAFDAVDLYSSVTPIPYVIRGRLGANDVLILTGTVPNTFGRFAKVANINAPQMLESLYIQLVNPATPCCNNPMGPDNIVLRR